MMPQRAKQIAGAGGLVLAAYLVTLGLLFPASLAWRLAEPGRDLPFALDPGTLSGPAWGGRAGPVRVNGQDVGTVAWRWQPGPCCAAGWDWRWNGRWVRIGCRATCDSDVAMPRPGPCAANSMQAGSRPG
jgi:hypothetical protein